MVEKFYTPKQIAGILQIHQYTVLKWIRGGKLKGLKYGRVYRIPESELAMFLGTESRQQGRVSTEVSSGPMQEAGDESKKGELIKKYSTIETPSAPETEDHYVL